MTIRESVGELLRVYKAALLLPNGGVVDPTRAGQGGSASKPTSTIPSFGADVPLAAQIERALARFVMVWQRRLEEARLGVEARPSHDRKSPAKRAEDRAILAAEGEDPTALAFIYGRTTEGVRKLRQRAGLDPDTGERVKRDVLTAPAHVALEAYESAKEDQE